MHQASPSSRVLQRTFDRCAATFDEYAFCFDEVRDRLLDRLRDVRLSPDRVLDLGCGTGRAVAALRSRYPSAELVLVDSSLNMVRRAQQSVPDGVLLARLPHLPLASGSMDLVFANLCLPCCDDLRSALAAIARVLKPGGLLAFTTLGPDSFRELQAARQAAGDKVWPPFADMHLVGDGLVEAGLGDPVLDVDYLQVTYSDSTKMWRELAGTGVAPGHTLEGGLLGCDGRRERLQSVYPRGEAKESPYVITLEVIFGHAWRGQAVTEPGEVAEFRVPIAEIRRR